MANRARPTSRSKYRNEPVVIDGMRFDSKAEAKRWGDLRMLERAGLITGLQRQVTFPLVVNDHKVCDYRADFVYTENGERVVEDVKGVRTADYRIKAALMLALYQIAIRETPASGRLAARRAA